MTGRVAGKVALVVGAGSIGPGWGNGKASSVLLAREGAKLVCADRDLDAAQETVDLIKNEGGDAIAVKVDATQEADMIAMVGAAMDAYDRIDILDNNVGIAEVGSVVDLTVERWDQLHDINLKSCFLGMKHVIPHMVAQGGGAIVNISSIAAISFTGVPYATYYTTKAAMSHLTRTTAAEFASRKVRVNAILPGLMKTPMVSAAASLTASYGDGDVDEMWKARDAQCPIGHMGDAWDVAYAALYLASDEAKYVTGAELVVDGGITLGYAKFES